MKKSHKLFLLLSIIYGLDSFAGVGFATGMSTVHKGRYSLLLHLNYQTKDFGFSGSSVGLESDFSYLNAYQANFYWIFEPKIDFLWAKPEIGLGVGLFYSQRGIRDLKKSAIRRHHDISPGLFSSVHWKFLGPLFFGIENFFGLSTNIGMHLVLAYRHVTIGLIGFQF